MVRGAGDASYQQVQKMKKEKKTADKLAYHREYMKSWRQKAENKKKLAAYSREYYRRRKENEDFKKMLRESHSRWAKEHPEKIKEYAKRAYQKSKKRTLQGCE